LIKLGICDIILSALFYIERYNMNDNYLKELGDQIAIAHWGQTGENTYEEICDRVVNYICDDPSDEGRRYNHRMKELLKNKKFIPNSPCWINSGTDMKNLFACYVIDLQDNMNSIMDAAKRMAMIMKEGGGDGISLTPIRAEGARVGGEGSNRTASGPISFLKVFD
jgi:ribonucleoside-diphosphate reductase alpha chain